MPQGIVEEDRRAIIEAAFAEAEDTTPEAKAPEAKPAESGTQLELPLEKPAEAKPAEQATPAEVKPTEQANSEDRPPQSWKAAPKGKWATLDPEIKQEVLRREVETTRVLNDTAQARQFVSQFQQAVQPYMARIQSMNAHPIAAVSELFKADHILSTAPKVQKAQYLAKLISDYGVDIEALDQVLSGKIKEADPVESKVEQLLQQRLAPFQQYLTQQEQAAQYYQQQQAQQLQHTVESMAADPKYPHFEAVRETMADIVEVFAKRGQALGLEEAYNKAIAMDPRISQVQQVNQMDTRARKALAASVSVNGAPTGPISASPNVNDRRATIAAAFDASAGR